jgi:hypothetical protein
MAVTRPTVRLGATETKAYDVYTGSTIRKGFPVKFYTGTKQVVEATAVTDNIIGIARDAGDAAGTSGLTQIGVYIHGGIVPVLVGTGGATAGVAARLAVPSSADGVTDATTGGGTGKIVELGIFEDTGVAADMVGLRLNITPTVGS